MNGNTIVLLVIAILLVYVVRRKLRKRRLDVEAAARNQAAYVEAIAGGILSEYRKWVDSPEIQVLIKMGPSQATVYGLYGRAATYARDGFAVLIGVKDRQCSVRIVYEERSSSLVHRISEHLYNQHKIVVGCFRQPGEFLEWPIAQSGF